MSAKPQRPATPVFPALARRRIFGIVAHIDAGKTTVSERMLLVAGIQYRFGLVDEGTATMDFEDAERERGITIHSAAIDLPWAGDEFTFVDTPGHVDFTVEVERCMRVLDGVVVVLDSSQGVEAQTEAVWRQAERFGVRRIAFLNKLDKVGASWERTLASLEERLGAVPVSLAWPAGGEGAELRLADLVGRRLLSWSGPESELAVADWPAELRAELDARREALVDLVAEHDEDLLGAWLDDEDVDEATLEAAIRRQTLAGTILPVLGGAALRSVGVEPLMDAVAKYLPSPQDVPAPIASVGRKHPSCEVLALDAEGAFVGRVFKLVATRHGTIAWLRVHQGALVTGDQLRNARTQRVERAQSLHVLRAGDMDVVEAVGPGQIVALRGLRETRTGDTLSAPREYIELQPAWDFPLPVISMAVEPRRVEDKDKLEESLARLAVEDPSMEWKRDDETGQLLVSGMGELHLQILRARLADDFKVAVRLGSPRVAYRESLRVAARQTGTFVRQLKGREIECWLDIAFTPAPDREHCDVRFEAGGDDWDGGQEALVRETAVAALEAELSAGFVHGFPVTQLEAVVHGIAGADGALPAGDEVEAAIGQCLRELGRTAELRILEPWMRVEVRLPEGSVSPVLGDLQAQGGEIDGVEVAGEDARLCARAALSKLLDFTTRLRSLTQGRGTYAMCFDRYADVPAREYTRIAGLD